MMNDWPYWENPKVYNILDTPLMFSSNRVVTSPSISSGAAPGNWVVTISTGCSVSGFNSTTRNVEQTYPNTITRSTRTITVMGNLTEASATFIFVHLLTCPCIMYQ